MNCADGSPHTVGSLLCGHWSMDDVDPMHANNTTED